MEKEICPECGYIAGYSSYFQGIYCTHCGWVRLTGPSNRDRLRNMTEAGIAHELAAAFFKNDKKAGRKIYKWLCQITKKEDTP